MGFRGPDRRRYWYSHGDFGQDSVDDGRPCSWMMIWLPKVKTWRAKCSRKFLLKICARRKFCPKTSRPHFWDRLLWVDMSIIRVYMFEWWWSPWWRWRGVNGAVYTNMDPHNLGLALLWQTDSQVGLRSSLFWSHPKYFLSWSLCGGSEKPSKWLPKENKSW